MPVDLRCGTQFSQPSGARKLMQEILRPSCGRIAERETLQGCAVPGIELSDFITASVTVDGDPCLAGS